MLVNTIMVPVCSGEQSKYPCSNFAHGISNLKLVMASEWAGVAFSISLIVSSEQGFELFDKVRMHCEVLPNNEHVDCNDAGHDNEMTTQVVKMKMMTTAMITMQ